MALYTTQAAQVLMDGILAKYSKLPMAHGKGAHYHL